MFQRNRLEHARLRMSLDHVLAGILTALAGCLIFVLQPFGLRGPAFLGVAAALGALQFLRKAEPASPLAPGLAVRGPKRSSLARVRRSLSALCVIWLGLIAWAEASPGGQAHPSRRPPEDDPGRHLEHPPRP